MFNLMFKNAKCEDVRNFTHLDEKHAHTQAHTVKYTMYPVPAML